MHPNDLKRLAIATLAATALIALRPGVARADQRIACPVLATQLDTAEPIIGPVNGPAPWGELHSDDKTLKDGTFVQEYYLSGGVTTQLEKWIICKYADDTYKALKLPTETKKCSVAFKSTGADPATKKPRYRVDITCSP